MAIWLLSLRFEYGISRLEKRRAFLRAYHQSAYKLRRHHKSLFGLSDSFFGHPIAPSLRANVSHCRSPESEHGF